MVLLTKQRPLNVFSLASQQCCSNELTTILLLGCQLCALGCSEHSFVYSSPTTTTPRFPGALQVRILEDKNGVVLHGLEEVHVKSATDIFQLLDQGSAKRRTAETLLNKQSSRSHSVFTVTVSIRWGRRELAGCQIKCAWGGGHLVPELMQSQALHNGSAGSG